MKRFENRLNREKRYFKTLNPVWDNKQGKGLNIFEMQDLMNEQDQTIQELYDFRLTYNAHLFNEWHKNGTYEVYKSRKHHDGTIPFEDDEQDWFIVVAILPTGQITNHYHIKHWDWFKIPEYEKVKDEFDDHTSTDVLLRLGVLLQ